MPISTRPISGWRRPDGRLGIRNHVVILPLDTRSGELARAVAKQVPGTVVLPLPETLSEGTDDAAFRARIAIGLCLNPNVAGGVVLGSHNGILRETVDAVSPSGKPITDHDAADGSAIRAAGVELRRLLRWANDLRRVEAAWPDLWIGTKCEQTDATAAATACPTIGAVFDRLVPLGIHAVFGETPELVGAADAIAARAADRAAARKWERIAVSRRLEQAAAVQSGIGHPQPTPFNIAGGLSTQRAKALSSLAKIGHACRYGDVVAAAEIPSATPGLYLMDTSSETVAISQMSAGGCVLHLLATGGAVTIADPVAPIIQVNGNPATLRKHGDAIDLDVAASCAGIEECGSALIALVESVCRGSATASERRR